MVFELTVNDNRNATSISTVKVTVNPVNHPPVANAGQSQTVNAGYVVSLDGSGSRDPDGDPIRYSWVQTAGPSVNLTGTDSAIATFTAPSNISSDTDLTFNLTVTDDKNASNMTAVKITDKYVPPPNQPPVAIAGQNQTVNSGDRVTLDGSGSRDPDGSIASYSWTQTKGPSVDLIDANTSVAKFVAPRVFLLLFDHLFMANPSFNMTNQTSSSSGTSLLLGFALTVKDDKGAASDPATVYVTVKAARTIITINNTISIQSNWKCNIDDNKRK